MRKIKILASFVMLCLMVVLLVPPVDAAIPGIGKILGRFFGKSAAKQTVQKGAGRAITGKAVGRGMALLPHTSKQLVKTGAAEIFAKAAPKPWVPKVTPGQILAVGGAAGMVIVGNSTANAIENVGSATADAVHKVGVGTAENLPMVTGQMKEFAGRRFDTAFFYLFLMGLIAMTLLFWRFGMMPWHAAAGKQADRRAAGSVSACADVKDAEIVEVDVECRKDDKPQSDVKKT